VRATRGHYRSALNERGLEECARAMLLAPNESGRYLIDRRRETVDALARERAMWRFLIDPRVLDVAASRF
jgi:hypothetical protein